MHLHLHAGREAQHVHRGGREVDRQPHQVGDGGLVLLVRYQRNIRRILKTCIHAQVFDTK